MSSSDFVNRGQALVASGQFQEAVKVCRLGLLGRPTTVEGRIVLGQALLALKRFDEVLAEMRIAIELDHTSVVSLMLKGEALLRKGDTAAAIETLNKARAVAPTDPQVASLLAEAEQASRLPAGTPSASHPAVGFVRNTSTRNYPGPPEDDDADSEETGDSARSYTRQTSIAAPAARDGRSKRQAAVEPVTTPKKGKGKPKKAKVPGAEQGERTGTVEVDPELEGVEVDDDDIGALSPPPSMRNSAAVEKPRGPKGSAPGPAPSRRPGGDMPRRDSGMELDSDDLIDVDDETPPPVQPMRPAARSAVRASVGIASGPLDQYPPGQPTGSLAQAIAGQPHVMQVTPVSASPQVPQSSPRAPTMMPQQLLPPHLQQASAMQPAVAPPLPSQTFQAAPPPPGGYVPTAGSAMPTMAIQQGPPPGPPMPGGMAPGMPWQQSTMIAGNNGMPGGGLDPALAALAQSVDASTSGSIMHLGAQPVGPDRGPMKTGVRKTRSPLRVLVWIVLGAGVIGGGVFAGFQIRAKRLGNQIETARGRATELAKDDTWAGWSAARDGLAGIVQAQNNVDNRASLARARASIAFELGDGLPDAKAAVDSLGSAGGLDGQLAVAYLALAEDDPKAAKTASDAALATAPNDAAALYVAGRAQLLAGDAAGSIAHLKAAVDKDGRALYAVGLAHAYDAMNQWDDGLAACEKALGASADNPAALIERAELDVRSGKVLASAALASDIRVQLDKIIAEGARPLGDQARGVSPEQVALANVALAHVYLTLGDKDKAFTALSAALGLKLDDQRVVEEIIDVLVAMDEPDKARRAAEETVEHWPNSRRARIALAEALTALGKPADALAALQKSGEVTTLPIGLVARGYAKLANGDTDGARADFDSALKHEPKLEAAMIARATLDAASPDKLDEARKLLEPRFTGKDVTASLRLLATWADVLRATGDPAKRDQARVLIEKLATVQSAEPDHVRARVVLARIYRDAGDEASLRSARENYGIAAADGNLDARLESAMMSIENRDPAGGYASLVEALKLYTPAPPANALIETAFAAMLVGDHKAASEYLDQAEKARGLVRWQLDRERARFLFRRGDLVEAAKAAKSALDACGPDPETYLVAADIVYTDVIAASEGQPQKAKELADAVQTANTRIANRPEVYVVGGIMSLASNNLKDAGDDYAKADGMFEAEKASFRRRARSMFGHAIVAYLNKNAVDEKERLDTAIDEDPTNYAAHLYRADLFGDQKNPKAALADAQLAVQLNPDLLDGWFLVGKYAHDSGDKKTAAEALAMMQKIAPDNPRIKELQDLK